MPASASLDPSEEPDLQKTFVPLDEEAERAKYRVGTLQYTKASLVILFGWMILGNLCFGLFENVGGPDILKTYLQDSFHVSTVQVNILFGSIPMVIGTIMTPIISFKSDRTRSRFGRRIPYILFTAPFLVFFAMALGFTDDIIAYCKTILTPQSFISPFTAALIAIGFLTIGFSVFNEFVGTVYWYLLPDVMPRHFIGRFQGVSQMVGFGVGILTNAYITPNKLTHIKAIHVGVAVLYIVGLSLVCWRVKEGKYPPVTDVSKRTPLWEQVQLYFRECFTHPIFILFYISTAVTMLSKGLNPAGVFALHISEHQSTVTAQKGTDSVALSPNGKKMFAGGADGTLASWDLSNPKSPKLLRMSNCEIGPVRCIAMTRDGTTAIVGSESGVVEIRNVLTDSVIQRFQAHVGAVKALAIAPDERIFATGGEDKMVSTWNLDTGRKTADFKGHDAAVNSVSFSADSQKLASGSTDKRIIIWDAQHGTRLKTIEGSPGPIYAVAFMPRLVAPPPDNRGFFSSIFHTSTHFLHNVFTNESFYDPTDAPTSRVMPGDEWIIAGGRDGQKDSEFSHVRIWDAGTGALIQEMKGHKAAVTSVAYKPDLKVVLTGSVDSIIRLWKPLDVSPTADDQSFKTFSGYTGGITSIACADTGVNLVNAGREGNMHVWDIDQGVSFAKDGLRGIFFSILGLFIAYPLGAYVDRHNPLRIHIITTLILLPTMIVSFFFMHSYIVGFWIELYRFPFGQLAGLAGVPLTIMLYPKAKYGQFASANALVRQFVGAVALAAGGYLMDLLTRKSLNTDNFRYGFLFQFVSSSLSLCALVGVYYYWKRLGGRNYVAPGDELLPPKEN